MPSGQAKSRPVQTMEAEAGGMDIRVSWARGKKGTARGDTASYTRGAPGYAVAVRRGHGQAAPGRNPPLRKYGSTGADSPLTGAVSQDLRRATAFSDRRQWDEHDSTGDGEETQTHLLLHLD
ncbi:hypothetical protein GCM10012285_49120 [Streptomyces kronopolitis]|uniref:Uncharacterized protein n=1 Tax=Streptomyces kronopolitis TaxID=1612435 RepID=A0ABQ2JUS5_9ACTN|nr:hypothetical protein GCM10012285_49120 [Streptomyces kronopolitis]